MTVVPKVTLITALLPKTIHRKMRRLLAYIVPVLIAAACTTSGEQSHFQYVGSQGWLYGDTVSHHIELSDSTDSLVTGNIALAVRHTDAYDYSNLWVEVSYLDSDSLRRDTFDVRLADEYGRWLGTGIGVGFQKVDTLLRGVKVDPRHPLQVRHIMRTDTLPDIEQIGLIFVAR